jgi:pimeloyl-ACP methyl ester carboxylesterase
MAQSLCDNLKPAIMSFLHLSQPGHEQVLFYQDYGKGQPVILIHGWPLNHASWELQIPAIVDAGFRCIAYDRRGFGKSSAPYDGYDYDSLAADLHALINHLELDDVVLVGFSMGGGEVVRYFTNYGGKRVVKAALVASIIPLVAQKEDNPDGVPQPELEKIMQALKTDRVGFLKDFHKNFYNYNGLGKSVSEARLEADFIVASQASGVATVKCAEAWGGTDFRPELKNVNVPTLIVHGDADNIVPIATSAQQAAKGIANNQYEMISDAPHGLNATHAEELNKLLIAFLKK